MRALALAALLLASAPLQAQATARDGSGESSALRTETLPLPGGSVRELAYRGRDLVEERIIDRSGALIEELFFDSGSSPSKGAAPIPYEKRAYLRSETGRLLRVEARDSAGALLGSMDYRYDRDGRLLGVASSGSFGAEAAGMIISGGPPQGSWTSGSGTTTALSYDEGGRPTSRRTLREGKAVALERRIYGEGPHPGRIETEDLVSGELTIVDCDGEGRNLVKIVSIGGRETARVAYSYDGEGRLAEEATRYSSGGITTRSLSYLADGSLGREETRRDGVIIGAVDYFEGGRIEELYRGGELFVKATYRSGRKVKDEFYAEGAPVREKEYQ